MRMAQNDRLLVKHELYDNNIAKKSQTVSVELIVARDRILLQAKKKSKECLCQINCDNIGAIVSIKLENKKNTRMTPRNGLVIFYEGDTALSEWHHLILVDTIDTPSTENSVIGVRRELTEHCLLFQYQLKPINTSDSSRRMFCKKKGLHSTLFSLFRSLIIHCFTVLLQRQRYILYLLLSHC